MTIAPAERVETSLEEIAALDFEPEVPCEADPDKPHSIATWYGIGSCGRCKALCSRCKIRYEIWMARYGIFCDHCSQPITIRFEPLR